MKSKDTDQAVDNFVKGQQQAEQAGSPGTIGTVQRDPAPSTPDLTQKPRGL